jgi:hypothetical protein
MDAIDEKLLLALRENGRASTAECWPAGGTLAHQRPEPDRAAGEAGHHRRLWVRLAPEHGLGAVRAHVMIKVGPKETRAVTAALRAIPRCACCIRSAAMWI